MIVKDEKSDGIPTARSASPTPDPDPPPKYHEVDALEDQRPLDSLSHPHRRWCLRALWLGFGALWALIISHLCAFHATDLMRSCSHRKGYDVDPTTQVRWRRCGSGIDKEVFVCANVTVPLDHLRYGKDDNRTAVIAVTKRFASNPSQRLGSLFLNLGGPGISGTRFVLAKGGQIDEIVKGTYDLIGFDPRGVNLTRPAMECFPTGFDAQVYHSVTEYRDWFDLPVNASTTDIGADLHRQIAAATAAFQSAASQCAELTGDELAYMGTEAVVRDLEYMAKLFDDGPVNFWGLSYGTIIGQYLLQILPKASIGRVVIDGVVDPEKWSSTPEAAIVQGLENVDDAGRSFAESCALAGKHCALSDLSSDEILRKLDSLIDHLYVHPEPVTGLASSPHVGVAHARHLREFFTSSLHRIDSWPAAARVLADAFDGNYTTLLDRTLRIISPEDARDPDPGEFNIFAIACADLKPSGLGFSSRTIADAVIKAVEKYGPRSGDTYWPLGLCGFWPVPSRSRYSGNFGLSDGALDTPVLVISNTYDPVTPLVNGQKASGRLGNNARLIQQDGWGHCSPSQVSYCTVRAVRDFFVEGKVPTQDHTICPVDQHAFIPFDPKLGATRAAEFGDSVEVASALSDAWKSVGEAVTDLGKRGLWR